MNTTKSECFLPREKFNIYTIPEAAEILRISRTLAYQLAKSGVIPTIKLGSKRRIVTEYALEKLLNVAQ